MSLAFNASWNQNATTVAGWANGTGGSSSTQLKNPFGLSITTDDMLYICDSGNDRIMRVNLTSSQSSFFIPSGPYPGTWNTPHDVFNIDKLIYVLDTNNHRVQKRFLHGPYAGTVLNYSQNYRSYFFYVDENVNIYLSATENHEVIYYPSGSTNSTRIAGTGTSGSDKDALNRPYGIFVDSDGTVSQECF